MRESKQDIKETLEEIHEDYIHRCYFVDTMENLSRLKEDLHIMISILSHYREADLIKFIKKESKLGPLMTIIKNKSKMIDLVETVDLVDREVVITTKKGETIKNEVIYIQKFIEANFLVQKYDYLYSFLEGYLQIKKNFQYIQIANSLDLI
jgi:hypothetical protein